MKRVIGALLRLLDPTEREYVCGDLEELKLSAAVAAASILGLVIRRQLTQWRHWGPWLGLLGVVGLSGYYLSGSVGQIWTVISLQVKTYLTYGVAYEPGGVSAAQQIAYASAAMIAVLLWAWASGFVLAALSGRALWITSILFYIVVRDASLVRMALSGNIILKHGLGLTALSRLLPLEPVIVVWSIALVFGVRSATKGTLKQNPRLQLAALGLAFVILLTWMQSWFAEGIAHWSGQPYDPAPFFYRVLPVLACAWPVLSIPLCEKNT